MWRQNAFPGNDDSDQSISDEDELNGDLRENSFSLTTRTEKEQGLLLQSRLEILRGKDDNQSNFFVEDDVEMPDFPYEGGSILSRGKESTCHPDQEIISDSEDDCGFSKHATSSGARKLQKDSSLNTYRNEIQDGACTWSMINKEAEALIHLNDGCFSSASTFSKANKSYKGVTGKVKPKFSLHFKLHKDGLPQHFNFMDENISSSSAHGVPEQFEPTDDGTADNSDLEFLKDYHGENDKQLKFLPTEMEAFANRLNKHTMSELLDGLQDRNVVPRRNSKMSGRTKDKRTQLIVKKSLLQLGKRIINNEEQPELVVSGSSDDEASIQHINLANLAMKKQTMADQFQEALAAASLSNEGVHVTAAKLSGKLQQVMQSEKEMDADFLRRIQLGPSTSDESHSIVVKILSRYLDAKLIVCRCSFGKNRELADSSQTFVDGREGTIIFSPKVCSDVDLEVGNLICIHPPWKEVQLMHNDEKIILSTYFSHI
ncbi:uncharacterized protein LOC8271736 isoform X2 [Ricinus communis]|uniref:uncharacterized protein LOC8271736 isoform X2 n=1 Tax=Ricinus communis TaxID=3988 RepID=UPI00201A6223|nr:uncharacterized protein LOC8271736 isoform X2 [Ricinus communis]